MLRASGGLYYDRIPLRAVSNALQRDGVKYRVALVTFGQAGAPAFPAVIDAFPPGILTNITSIDPDIDNGMARQANIQLERQILSGLRATIGYLHLSGRRIIMSTNVNAPTLTASQAASLGVPNLGRPDPTVGNNSRFQGLGRSDFDGLTLAVRADARALGTLRLSYTLSKALDDAGNAFFSSPQDNLDVGADYGRSDNDQRHRLVVSASVNSPTTPGTTTWERISHGFSASTMVQFSSSLPFNLVFGVDEPAGYQRQDGHSRMSRYRRRTSTSGRSSSFRGMRARGATSSP